MDELFPNYSGRRRFILADGGTGTTLQDQYHLNLDSKLWSSQLILQKPHILSQLHRGWEVVGAQIISTATYQATLEQFNFLLKSQDEKNIQTKNEKDQISQNGTTEGSRKNEQEEEASIKCMRSSIDLVRDSIKLKDFTKVSLSLGPYGASLTPSEDYTGNYTTPNWYKKKKKLKQDEGKDQEDYLMEFHLNRLNIFYQDKDTWDKIDLVQFETIPNLNEVRAIRRAWKKLLLQGRTLPEQTSHTNNVSSTNSHPNAKPFIISFVFPGPNGEFPTGETAIQVLESALLEDTQLNKSLYAKPNGIGINCTKLKNLNLILKAWCNLKHNQINLSNTWLWIYPDGGPTYDCISRTWSSSDPPLSPQQWAKLLVEVALKFSYPWAGLVLGGCCKTGQSHIHELNKLANI